MLGNEVTCVTAGTCSDLSLLRFVGAGRPIGPGHHRESARARERQGPTDLTDATNRTGVSVWSDDMLYSGCDSFSISDESCTASRIGDRCYLSGGWLWASLALTCDVGFADTSTSVRQ